MFGDAGAVQLGRRLPPVLAVPKAMEPTKDGMALLGLFVVSAGLDQFAGSQLELPGELALLNLPGPQPTLGKLLLQAATSWRSALVDRLRTASSR